MLIYILHTKIWNASPLQITSLGVFHKTTPKNKSINLYIEVWIASLEAGILDESIQVYMKQYTVY